MSNAAAGARGTGTRGRQSAPHAAELARGETGAFQGRRPVHGWHRPCSKHRGVTLTPRAFHADLDESSPDGPAQPPRPWSGQVRRRDRAPRDGRGPARAGERQRRAGGRPARSSARALAERRRDRPALRLSHYQLDGGQLDRRRGADRVRPAGDKAHDRGAGRRAELSRVARREPLRVSRGHHRPTPGSPDVLVLRHDLSVHPVGQLVRSDPGRRVDRVGTPDARRASGSRSRCFAVRTRT